jgi:hypothetical protein
MSLDSNLNSLAIRTAQQDKLLLTLISGNVPNLTALTTIDKSNLVAALNELKSLITTLTGSAVAINDTTTSTTSTFSSSKITANISAAIAAVIDSAPAAFDTLKEIATYIASDQNVTTTLITGLSKRVAVDSAQTFTAAEKTQGRANIGAASVADTTAAFSAAADAQFSANNAQSAANAAQSTANGAVTAAATAQSTASSAGTAAAAAQASVNTLSAAVGSTTTDYVAAYNAALV